MPVAIRYYSRMSILNGSDVNTSCESRSSMKSIGSRIVEYFLGRAALERVAAQCIDRRIMGLSLATDALAPCVTRWPVRAGDEYAGEVTSAAMSPDLGRGVALAMLERGHWMPGHRLEVETPRGVVSATVSALPFAVPET